MAAESGPGAPLEDDDFVVRDTPPATGTPGQARRPLPAEEVEPMPDGWSTRSVEVTSVAPAATPEWAIPPEPAGPPPPPAPAPAAREGGNGWRRMLEAAPDELPELPEWPPRPLWGDDAADAAAHAAPTGGTGVMAGPERGADAGAAAPDAGAGGADEAGAAPYVMLTPDGLGLRSPAEAAFAAPGAADEPPPAATGAAPEPALGVPVPEAASPGIGWTQLDDPVAAARWEPDPPPRGAWAVLPSDPVMRFLRPVVPGTPVSTGTGLVTGVLLSLAVVSLEGGVHAFLQAQGLDVLVRTIVSAAAFVVLFSLGFLLRLVPGTSEVRSATALAAVLFIPAVVGYGLRPMNPGDAVREGALAVALTTLMAAVVAEVMPSAVAAAISLVGLVSTVFAAVASIPGATLVDAGGVAGALALLVPPAVLRFDILHPHPSALRWLLGASAPAIALPVGVLAVTADPAPVLAGVAAAVGLLLGARRFRSVSLALGGFALIATVEATLMLRGAGSGRAAQSVVLLVLGIGVLGAFAVCGSGLLDRAPRLRWRLPIAADEAVHGVAVLLALASLVTSAHALPGLT